MNSLLPLYQQLLADASDWCCASTTRDFETITRRVEHEGISFLTISLPSFCTDFERSLADGVVSPACFVGFSKHGALPRFLGGLLERVFDRSSGSLLSVPDIQAIFYIRQVCLYSKKIRLPCSSDRVKKAFVKYVECEQEVRDCAKLLSEEDLFRFSEVSAILFGSVLSGSNLRVEAFQHVPRHGPGKTADNVSGNRKFQLQFWTRRLEENFFPSADFLIPNYGFKDELSSVHFFEPGSEPPVKVVQVPKTLKTPRIIAMEPAHMQYAQQSLMELLVVRLERSRRLNGMIGFTNQIPNQCLAQQGSSTGEFATLDLSEASDRVSLRLVCRLLKNYPSLMRAVMSCRSQRADVPGFGTLSLAKFASMGSALCFPIEAMVFLTIIFIGIQNQLKHRLTPNDIKKYHGRVRVYGDDIIVPVDMVQSVVESLESFGLKVNAAKSFWTGKFRESCGGEYYDGVPVKPVRLTMMPPTNRRQAGEFSAFVAQRNQLYEQGLWKLTRYIDNHLGRLAPFPVVGRDSQGLGRHSFLNRVSEEKWCSNLQHWLAKAAVVVSKIPKSPLDDYGALMKHFLKRGSDPYFSDDHLSFAGRPRSVDTRLRWVPTR
jgi:hypothetical protein